MKNVGALAQLINKLTVLEDLIQANRPIPSQYAETVREARQLAIIWELLGIAAGSGETTSHQT